MRRALLPLLMLSLAARAEDNPELPPPPRLGEPAPPAALPPLEAPPPLGPPVVVVGTVESESVRVALVPHEAHLQACAQSARPEVSPGKPGALPTGEITFRITVRRGKATLSVDSTTAPGLEWIEPCLQKELVHVEWPVRRGAFQVPVMVEPAPAQP